MIYKIIRLKLFSLKIKILLNIKFKRKREKEGQVYFNISIMSIYWHYYILYTMSMSGNRFLKYCSHNMTTMKII